MLTISKKYVHSIKLDMVHFSLRLIRTRDFKVPPSMSEFYYLLHRFYKERLRFSLLLYLFDLKTKNQSDITTDVLLKDGSSQ